VFPVLGELGEAGDPAEQPQGDRLDLVPVPHGDDRVAELVEEDAAEQPECGRQPECPRREPRTERGGVDAGAERLVHHLGDHPDLRADEVGEKRQYDQKRPVEPDRDPQHRPDLDSTHTRELGGWVVKRLGDSGGKQQGGDGPATGRRRL